jgi:hypothetical protein
VITIAPSLTDGSPALQTALEILGFGPVAHGGIIPFNILDLEMARDGLEAKFRPETARCKPFGRAEFDHMLGEYRATTDTPFCHFGRELMAAYPDAKVILVERDIDSWHKSFKNTVATIAFRRGLVDRFVNFVLPEIARQRRTTDDMFTIIFNARSREEVVANSRDVYRRHYQEIRDAARPGQMLEYKLGSGWEPLCKFLDRPVPDVPFPRVNDMTAFQRGLAMHRVVFFMRAVEKLAFGLVVIAVSRFALVYLYSSSAPR